MCTVCGCGQATIADQNSHHKDHRHHHDGNGHDHHHGHSHTHGSGDIDFGGGLAGVHMPGMSQERIVQIERDILDRNDGYAARNRALLAERGVFALNFVSSPGSGKTTLLVRMISDLKDRFPIAVIEGDQQTANDADRIRETGAPAIQVNTGKGCHLDAHMVGHAMEELPLDAGGFLFIENVGNLVCPAAFDLGEAHKVAILSVTEGEDKPLKYPDMFAAADVMLLTKTDLLPHLDFDVEMCLDYARRINPGIRSFQLSAKTGDGLAEWYSWLETARQGKG